MNPAVAIAVIAIVVVLVGVFAWTHANKDVVSVAPQAKVGKRDK